MSLTQEDLNQIKQMFVDYEVKMDKRFQKLEAKVDAIQTSIYEEVCPLISAENARLYDRLQGSLGKHIMSKYPHTHKEFREFLVSDGDDHGEDSRKRIESELRK